MKGPRSELYSIQIESMCLSAGNEDLSSDRHGWMDDARLEDLRRECYGEAR